LAIGESQNQIMQEVLKLKIHEIWNSDVVEDKILQHPKSKAIL
jgi:hypothetical protein